MVIGIELGYYVHFKDDHLIHMQVEWQWGIMLGFWREGHQAVLKINSV